MFGFRQMGYAPLEQKDSSGLYPAQQTYKVQRSRTWQLVGALVLAVFSFVMGWKLAGVGDDMHFGSELAWAPDLAALPRTWKKFDGNFDFLGDYKGEPSPAIDSAWYQYSGNPLIDGTGAFFAVTEEDIRRSRKGDDWFNSTTEFEAEDGGGYMATLEIFHQLHCLNLLRMNNRPDYYHYRLHWNTTEHVVTKHLDHCVDIIRQVIMCSGDTSLVTYHWVAGLPQPYPDFSTWHQCRDPEMLLDWARARQPRIKRLMVKEERFVEMPEAP